MTDRLGHLQSIIIQSFSNQFTPIDSLIWSYFGHSWTYFEGIKKPTPSSVQA
nr:MAG TPA: hypothetical protein [Caudoviricetes sp.]